MTIRLATEADVPILAALTKRAIDMLQVDFLDARQIEASRAVMGLDTQLIADRCYFIVELEGVPAGCGGWSRRATLYGGDHSAALRDPALLDPRRDPARIRAMYTEPAFARRGVGRRLLAACEAAALAGGFTRAELMATLAGAPLYRALGYREIEQLVVGPIESGVPLIRMDKPLVA